MKSFLSRATALLFFSTLAAVAAGCGGSSGPAGHKDAGQGHDRADDMKVTPHPDGGSPDGDAGAVNTCGMNGPTQGLGAACACDAECGSGHCADGLCCENACTSGCETCSAPDAGGLCVKRSFGAAPRNPADCVADTPSTCGLDGTCDGAGACHYFLGNTCVGGTCSGDSVVGAYACDGTGACKPGITQMLCVPYTCDPSSGTCFESCSTAQGQCDSQHSCDLTSGSCGQARAGAHCNDDSGCLSGYCADNVCCNIACQGACVACDLPGRLGACLPIDPGKPDPRGICKDQGSSTCGHNGTCDGVGGCANYARDTQCLQPSCTGNRLNTAGTCDGLGTCRAPGVQDCHPFRCVDGACTTSCQSVNDCDTGTACINETCGPKPIGATCGGPSECSTNFCVDGVCCESACSGTCQYCALPTSPGFCMTVAADNPDPRGLCQDMGAAVCKTNGKCDGAGSCETYASGTVCAGETCASGVYTAASTCNTTGQCVAPDSHPCTPYICNGSQCFNVCATNDQCKAPNTCSPTNSCGPKPPGAVCGSTDECQTGLSCAQGYCCNSPCTGACQTCALPSSLGVCTNVPATQVDPTGQCTDRGATSCGTNGKCDGNGGCALYVSGTTCIGSSCPSGTSTFTGTSSCDGAGNCVTPNNTPCFPYQCGLNICKNSCTSNADCQSPAVCNSNGSCGLKGIGQACVTAAECGSGFCSQQTCCQTACTGACQSCALTGSPGACTNVPSGTADPQATCHDQGSSTCGTDGFCDGNGACRKYVGGTSCAPPSCSTGSTLTSGRTCNGTGTCQAATMISCAPYVCNGSTACKAACAVDTDCLSPDICDPKTNLCGTKKRLGQACTLSTDCLTGDSCVDGVCCSASACLKCQACNIAGSAGNCANVPASSLEPHGLCATNPPCGNTGACDGNGACQLGGTSVSCGTASCPSGSSTFTPISHCNGSGACAAPVSSTCPGGFNCNSTTASCKTTCTADGDCVAPLTCQGSGSTQTCAKKPNGQACPGGAVQCISGFCTDGVCCGTGPCGTCQACNVNGLGSCAPLAAGTAAPAGQCAANGTCGNTGTCNGGGACTQAATSVTCAAASCSTNAASYTPASFCSGGGSCSPAGALNCSPYFCGTGGCKTTCNNVDSDCISGDYCTGAAGACLPVKSLGVACFSNHECGSGGNCVDGVCCSSPSCGTCQSCNVTGNGGTCTLVGANVAEPHGKCAANGTCGNTGLCTSAGACAQQPTSVSCAGTACSGSTFTPTSFCSGAGSCAAPATQSCSPYLCSGSSCASSCNLDTDCLRVTGNMNYCTGTSGSCLPVKSPGVACIAGHECASGNCVDGVCCGSPSCGTCQACNLVGSLGICANVAANSSELHGKCPANGTCGNTGLCNGSGACLQQPTTVSCAPASCSGSTLTPTSFCSSTIPTGSCATPATQSCSPYLCSGSSCASSCNLDTDCLNVSGNNNYCTGTNGSCLPVKANGVACFAGHECGSGFCIDGVCCGSNGCGTCQACNLAASLGSCANVGANTADLHGRCAANGVCGNTGLCNGGGACLQQPSTVMCSAPSCSGTTATLAAFCTGLLPTGSCPAAATASCGAYVCGATNCNTSCALDTDCINGDFCTSSVNGTCMPKNALATPCGSGHECSSGFCSDGVCCSSNGCGTCQSCALNGSGTCAAIAAGQTAPSGQCAVGATCGNTGLCNGASGCQQQAANTSCGSTSCSANPSQFTAAPKCDGFGSCVSASPSSCGVYVCSLAGCPGTCSLDTDCVAGYYCSGGSCVQQQTAGVACTSNDQCKSGLFCTEGFCCGSANCSLSCLSCAVPGFQGACTKVPSGGTDPTGTCQGMASAQATCLADGTCDGNGGCRNWPATTVCATSCSVDQSQFLRSFCTGTGACDMAPADQQVISCPSMVCDGTLGCQ